jgi:hypothetical protein
MGSLTTIEAEGKSQASVDDKLHRFTGRMSLACDRYIQYLFTGANLPLVLNRHGWGLQPWRCRLSTSLSTRFPINCPPLSPKGPARSQVNHSQHETTTQHLPVAMSTPSNS